MTRVAVVYHSSTGAVHQLAVAAAAAAGKQGAEVRLRQVTELPAPAGSTARPGALEHAEAAADVPVASPEDLDWADAILLGTPVHFGLASPALMHFINATSALSIAGRLLNKAVSAFAAGSAAHGGQVSAILALHNAICHWGSVVVPTGSTEPALYLPNNGNPYGASAVTGATPGAVHPENITAIEYQARRTIQVAEALQRIVVEQH